MAAECSKTEDKQLKCSICIDTYIQPRYLPTCGHTFCEQCLFTYTREAQQDAQGSNFRCPMCRKPHDLPENTEVTLQWVQTFPLNTVIIKMVEAVESTSNELKNERRTCHPCEAEGETNTGVKFCFDCKEILCIDCTKFHKRFKMSKGHKLADIETMPSKDIDVDVLGAISKCTTHEEQELDVYCKTHALFICMYCMATEHKACNVVPSSSPDIDMATLGEESEKLNAQIKAMLEHIGLLQKLREENKRSLKHKLKEIRDNAEQTKDQVVQLMERVVKHVADVTKQVEYESEHTLDEAMSRIAKLKHLTEQKRTLMDTIAKLGSDRHKYVSSQQIKVQCVEIETQITEEDKRRKVIEADLKLVDDIRKLLDYTDVEKLIELKMNDRDSNHRHYSVEPDQAGGNSIRDGKLVKVDGPNAAGDIGAEVNSTRDSKLVKVDEHTLRPNDECEPTFAGVSVLPDGRIVLCDFCDQSPNCGKLCLYNPVNKSMLQLKTSSLPFNVTCIDDMHLAVCCPLDHTISIVSIGDELKVEKTLNTKTNPCSIVALSNGQFAMSWNSPPAFSLVDISGPDVSQTMYLEQDKRGRKFESFDYLGLDERRQHVFQPCDVDKAVYCFDFTGEPVFTYSHPELREPRGVALDKCGNIYVCDYDSSPGSIHKLSPAGEPISIFKDGIHSFPLSICCDNTGTVFWVTQRADGHREKVVYFQLES